MFLLLAATCARLQTAALYAADDKAAAGFPYAVAIELGDAEFAPGDNITIESVRGTQSAISTGQTYCVQGTYTLNSKEEAELGLYVTATNEVATPFSPRQQVTVRKGSGRFELVKTIYEPGYLHLTFYSGDDAIGGVYFGQGQWVLRNKGWSYLHSSSGAGQPLSEQNRRILEYLGGPVAPPPNLDPAYTKEGLASAMRLVAQKAGISLKRVEVDDSEFPFLVGGIGAEGGYPKVLEQIKRMPAYEEQGGVSGKTCWAINITPWRVFPSEASERIGRRMMLRERMLYDQLSRQL